MDLEPIQAPVQLDSLILEQRLRKMGYNNTTQAEPKGMLRKISFYLYDSEIYQLKKRLRTLSFSGRGYIASFMRKVIGSEFLFIDSSVNLKIENGSK